MRGMIPARRKRRAKVRKLPEGALDEYGDDPVTDSDPV